MSAKKIILASGSSSRRAMLKAAGVMFTSILPDTDEEVEKDALLAKGVDAAGIADALAEAKALSVSALHPAALVIGGDQVLVCGEKLFDKAADRAQARETLLALRGTSHVLISAAVLAEAGTVVWCGQETATLCIREFSAAFLDSYLDTELPGILGSVGCYLIEGRGAQLFERIAGDQYCIRGLPLLPLLKALRSHGALAQ